MHFLFGLAKTDRLIAEIQAELEGAAAQSRRTGKPDRPSVDPETVNSDSAVTLMVGIFAALAADPRLSHAEALRKSMLAMIDQHPEQADPKYWAPFVVVGEPAKPAN